MMEKKNSFSNIIAFVLFLAVFGLGLLGLYRLFAWKDTSGVYFDTMEQVKNLEKNTVDVVFTGPSHTYCGINPNIFWDEYGISAFDMSISGMDMYCTYYYLKEFLKNQSPKVVFVEISNYAYGGHEIQGNVYRAVLSMPNRKYAQEIIEKSVANSLVENKDFDSYRLVWPIIHTRYKELQKYDFIENPINLYGLGNTMSFDATEVSINFDALEHNDTVELSYEQKEWIDKIVDLSRENNFELLFFNTPASINYDAQAIYNSVYSYVQECYGSVCFDTNRLIDEIGLNVAKDFSDSNHLNSYGAEKLSAFFAVYLHENYDLFDHRGEEEYMYWNECSDFNSRLWLDHRIHVEESRKSLVKNAATNDNLLMVFAANDNPDEMWGLVEEEVEEYLGITSDVVQDGCLLVFLNGEQIWKANVFDDSFRYRLNSDTYLRINCFFDELGKLSSDIYVGDGACLVQELKGTYITVYDLNTDAVAVVKKLD